MPVDRSRELTNHHRRELAPYVILVATIMKRMFEEHQNELTNHMVNHIFDVLKLMITNMLAALVPGQVLPTNRYQYKECIHLWMDH